jgi:hypothetical protein
MLQTLVKKIIQIICIPRPVICDDGDDGMQNKRSFP